MPMSRYYFILPKMLLYPILIPDLYRPLTPSTSNFPKILQIQIIITDICLCHETNPNVKICFYYILYSPLYAVLTSLIRSAILILPTHYTCNCHLKNITFILQKIVLPLIMVTRACLSSPPRPNLIISYKTKPLNSKISKVLHPGPHLIL